MCLCVCVYARMRACGHAQAPAGRQRWVGSQSHHLPSVMPSSSPLTASVNGNEGRTPATGELAAVVIAPGSREEGRGRACVQHGLAHPESRPSSRPPCPSLSLLPLRLPSGFTLCSYEGKMGGRNYKGTPRSPTSE